MRLFRGIIFFVLCGLSTYSIGSIVYIGQTKQCVPVTTHPDENTWITSMPNPMECGMNYLNRVNFPMFVFVMSSLFGFPLFMLQ